MVAIGICGMFPIERATESSHLPKNLDCCGISDLGLDNETRPLQAIGRPLYRCYCCALAASCDRNVIQINMPGDLQTLEGGCDNFCTRHWHITGEYFHPNARDV